MHGIAGQAPIDYGMRTTDANNATPAYRAVIHGMYRCTDASLDDVTPDSCGTYSKSKWPDYPYDQLCSTTCTGKVAPTFMTKFRFASVEFQVKNSAGALSEASDYRMRSQFNDSGGTTMPTLLPTSIYLARSSGTGGTDALPKTLFGGVKMDNRVKESADWWAIPKWRINKITNEVGGVTSVDYSAQECSASNLPTDAFADSGKRCFAQKWWPPGRDGPQTDWFHKYVVDSVTTTDPAGGAPAVVTNYTYYQNPAWTRNDDRMVTASYRTWSQWHGYTNVKTRVGNLAAADPISETSTTYYRGVPGKTVTDFDGTDRADDEPLDGFVAATQQRLSPGGVDDALTTTTNTPWVRKTVDSARSDAHDAYYVDTAKEVTKQRKADGGTRSQEVSTTYNNTTGLPTSVQDTGDTAVTGDETCDVTDYVSARNTDPAQVWIAGLPSQERSYAGLCAAAGTPFSPSSLLGATQTSYDGNGPTASPSKGLETKSERSTGVDASGVLQWQIAKIAGYDGWGRVISESTLNDNDQLVPTTTAFTQTQGTLTGVSTSTTADGRTFTSSQVIDPRIDQPTKSVDVNGNTTRIDYDVFGRTTKVWLPNRAADHDTDGALANMLFSYNLTQDQGAWSRTRKLNHAGDGYVDTFTIYDSMMRERQIQTANTTGGRIIANTLYNSRGLVSRTQADIVATGAPGGPVVVDAGQPIPSETVNYYDAAERQTRAELRVNGAGKWGTNTSYGGAETVTVTPPGGAPTTVTTTDILGRTTRHVEKGSSGTGGSAGNGDLTIDYTYDPSDKLTTLVGPAGTYTYEYDFLGRRTKTVDPDTGTSTSTYTSGDQVATSTDARGKTLRHVYDNRGRQIGLYDGDTTDPAKLLTKSTYDTVKLGKPTSTVRRAPDGTTFTDTVTGYNAMGDATGSTFAIGNPTGGGIASGLPTSYASSTTYGADAQPDTVTRPALATGVPGETMQYSYNSLGDVSSIASGSTKLVGGVTYDDLGRLSTMKLGDATSPSLYLSRQYETGTGRLTRAWADRGTAATISDHTYSYTNAGDLTKDADTPTITGQGASAADVQCYRYDVHRRIVGAFTPASGDCADALATQIGGPAPYWQTWAYNTRGLRTSQSTAFGSGTSVETTTSSYPAADAARPNTVTGTSTSTRISGGPAGPATTASYGYDAAGNTTSRPAPVAGTGGSQSLSYSSEGDPEKITTSKGDIDYFYGSDGEVLVKNTPTKRTLYLGADEVTVSKPGGAVTAVRDYDTPLGTAATRSSQDGLTWLIPNAQNTSQVSVAGSTGEIRRRWVTPFGQSRTPSTGTGGTAVADPVAGWVNDHAFLNKPFESDTGLSDVGARMFDPGLGRFISPDPVIDPMDPTNLDPYNYADNNPIAKSDPSGLRPVDANGDDSAHATMQRPNPRRPGHWMPVSRRVHKIYRAENRRIQIRRTRYILASAARAAKKEIARRAAIEKREAAARRKAEQVKRQREAESFWQKTKNASREIDYGKAAAAGVNVAWGTRKVFVGIQTLQLTPFCATGGPGLVAACAGFGAYNIGSGGLKVARGVRQGVQFAKHPACDSECGLVDQTKTFARNVLPTFSGHWLDRYGGW